MTTPSRTDGVQRYIRGSIRITPLATIGVILIEEPDRGQQNRLIGPRQFAFILESIGLFSLILATLEHRQNIHTLGARYAGKQRSLAVLVAALISTLGILALVAIIFRQ